MRSILTSPSERAIEGRLWDKTRLAPSRRWIVRAIGLLPFAGLPGWIGVSRSPRRIVVVDGWIVADSDLR